MIVHALGISLILPVLILFLYYRILVEILNRLLFPYIISFSIVYAYHVYYLKSFSYDHIWEYLTTYTEPINPSGLDVYMFLTIGAFIFFWFKDVNIEVENSTKGVLTRKEKTIQTIYYYNSLFNFSKNSIDPKGNNPLAMPKHSIISSKSAYALLCNSPTSTFPYKSFMPLNAIVKTFMRLFALYMASFDKL